MPLRVEWLPPTQHPACRSTWFYPQLRARVRDALGGWRHVCRSLGREPVMMDRDEYVREYVRLNYGPLSGFTASAGTLTLHEHALGACCLAEAIRDVEVSGA